MSRAARRLDRLAFAVAMVALASGCGEPAKPPMGADERRAGARNTVDAASAAAWRSDGPVSVRLRADPRRVAAGEEFELHVDLRVSPSWEIHALEGGPAESRTRLELGATDAFEALGDWQAPEPAPSMAPGRGAAYAGTITVSRSLRVTPAALAGESTIECTIGYQACNDRQCLRPSERKLETTIVID